MLRAEDILREPLMKIFVYGTLRKGERLGFYLEGAKYMGKYYCHGQLMKSENDNVFIDFAYNDAVTIGEIYLVSFYCLQRINHLEVLSGTFPKGYDLNVLQVWQKKEEQYTFDEKTKELAFYYRWKNASVKILTGDFSDDFVPIEELEELLKTTNKEISEKEILEIMQKKLSIFQSINF